MAGSWQRFTSTRQAVAATRARDEAEKALTATRRAAGQTSDVVLSVAFGDFGRDEKRTADWLRYSAVALLLLIAAGAVLIVIDAHGQKLTTAEVVARLGIAVPIAGSGRVLGS